jgi:hypothetical protein
MKVTVEQIKNRLILVLVFVLCDVFILIYDILFQRKYVLFEIIALVLLVGGVIEYYMLFKKAKKQGYIQVSVKRIIYTRYIFGAVLLLVALYFIYMLISSGDFDRYFPWVLGFAFVTFLMFFKLYKLKKRISKKQ